MIHFSILILHGGYIIYTMDSQVKEDHDVIFYT